MSPGYSRAIDAGNMNIKPIEHRERLFGITLAILAAIWLVTASSMHSLNIREVEPVDAKALAESGALVIDVRGKEAFATRHIPGAILFPLDDLHGFVADKINAARDSPIVVYCGDGVRSGPEGTAILNQAGFANAVNLKGGIEGWQKAGFTTVTGPG